MEADDIISKYSKYDMLNYEVMNVPSFIKCLTNKYNQILLLWQKRIENEFGKESISKECETITLDLTGSPLADDLSCVDRNVSLNDSTANNWLDDEKIYLPLKVQQARFYAALYNLTEKTLDIDALFSITDGTDVKKTVLTGTANKEHIFDRFTTHIMGLFSRKDPKISIKTLYDEHIEMATSHLGSFKTTERVDCDYEILGPRIIQSKDLPLGSIFLKVSWNHASYKVQTPYETCLELESMVGHYEGAAFQLFYQLQYLQKCIELIESQHENSFDGHKKITLPSFIYKKTSTKSVMEQIEKLLFDGYLDKGQKKEIEIHESFEEACVRIVNREPEDFTDQLWSILVDAESYNELRDSLNYVYEKISFGDFLPYINSKNPTSIAQLIRNASKGKLYKIVLSDIQPIEILIELGLQKLFNDFQIVYQQCSIPITEIFSQHNFESAESNSKKPQFSLAPSVYMNSLHSSLSQTNIHKKLAFLAQIFTVTDILLLVENNLSKFSTFQYNKNIMHLFAQELTKTFCQKIDFNMANELSALQLRSFQIAVPSYMINMGGKKAQRWRLTLTSTDCDNNDYVEHIFYQSLQPVFPPNIYNRWEIGDLSDDEKYYCVKHLHLVNKIPHFN